MIQIAIDGPSGAGKSTIAKEVAKTLGFTYLDTGAMYRALGLYLLQNSIDPQNMLCIKPVLEKITITLDKDRVLLNGEDVSQAIRRDDISQAASKVGKHSEVRAHMVSLQKKMASDTNVVMEGRDICSVVLPNAQFKYFITADAEIRAKRRHQEQLKRGLEITYEEVLNDIILRDKRDTERSVVPLIKTEDAELIDTTDKSIDDIVSYIRKQVEHA